MARESAYGSQTEISRPDEVKRATQNQDYDLDRSPTAARIGHEKDRSGTISGRLRELLGDSERFDPGRPGVRALILLAIAAAVVAGIYAWRSQPVPEPLPPPTPASAGSPATPSPTASVTIHITGKVRDPGVLALPIGSRVVDAITAAGGIKKGADTGPLNLARRLVDGEQIVVGLPPPPGSHPLTDPATTNILSLNSATADQLEQLPGVGEVLAQRIIEYRDTHGGFQSIEQLREVSGIGERKYAELKDKVSP
ncbi:ComEA family DNA-binding protein [Acrocarpospora sp. B8E8]|uniref:ComEA family DNA-binding protein n=1 Tax=Acrocarpospora sp. B8E8 TaxID=3153572 RepID=UPI00325CD8D0